MIIYYTYTVISTVLTIFKNFSSSFHDNVLHQDKTPFKCSIVERIHHTAKYCDQRFLGYNGDMSINFLSIFSELNCFAYAQIHVRVAYLFFLFLRYYTIKFNHVVEYISSNKRLLNIVHHFCLRRPITTKTM